MTAQDFFCGFHLYGDLVVDDEIHFMFADIPPEIEFLPSLVVGQVGLDLHGEELLEGLAPKIGVSFQRFDAEDEVADAGIEEIEFRGLNRLPFFRLQPWLKEKTHECVFDPFGSGNYRQDRH